MTNETLLYLLAGSYAYLVLANLLIVATAFASSCKSGSIGVIETILIFILSLIPLFFPTLLFVKRRGNP